MWLGPSPCEASFTRDATPATETLNIDLLQRGGTLWQPYKYGAHTNFPSQATLGSLSVVRAGWAASCGLWCDIVAGEVILSHYSGQMQDLTLFLFFCPLVPYSFLLWLVFLYLGNISYIYILTYI